MKTVIYRKKCEQNTYTGNLLIAVVLFVFLVSCGGSSLGSKEKTVVLDTALMMPVFTMTTIDDNETFNSKDLNKDGLILLKYFSPDCSHCQNEAALFFTKKDSLANIKTIWVSGEWANLDSIKVFVEKYKIDQFNPLKIGKETSTKLLEHYEITGMPFAAIFKDNQLIKEYRGEVDFSELIKISADDL